MKTNNRFKALATAISLALAASSVQAQTVTGFEYIDGQPVTVLDITGVAGKAPSRAAEEYTRFGYCEDDIKVSVGFNTNEELKMAFLISRDMLGSYRNAKVMGVRVGLAAQASDVQAFIVEGNDLEAAPKMTATIGNVSGIGWEQGIFRIPYQIESDFLIVGYKGRGVNFIGFDGERAYENASYINKGGKWGSIYSACVNNGFGAPCIQLLLGGEDLPTNEMAIGNILTKHVEQGRKAVIRGEAYNNTSKAPVQNYEVTCQTSEGKTVTKLINEIVATNQTHVFEVEMPPFENIGTAQVQVTISRVNGVPDEDPSNNSTIAKVNVVENGCYFPRTVVAEEATSVECGYCPSGIVVMQSMKERLKDFIGIAVHVNDMAYDPMTVTEYEYIQNYFSDNGLPNGIVNRKRSLSGMPVYFERYYEQEAGQLSIAKLVVEASTVRENSIDLKTDVTFAQDVNGSRYSLSYVLVEDDVAGPDQKNSYAGGHSGQMAGWESLPGRVPILYQDVARGVWELSGITGSIPADVTKKQPVTHNYSIKLPSTVDNYDKLYVVAMLHDNQNGDEIVQAAKTRLGENSMTGIATIAPEKGEAPEFLVVNGSVTCGDLPVEVYTIDGRRVANCNLPSGIYIARCGIHSVKVSF